MAWDRTLPADATKIRNAPTVIQANWDAIERNTDDSLNQWIVELVDRATIAGANTPTNVTSVGLLYARDDGGDVNLFYQDDTGNEVQMTTSNAMGNVGNDLEMNRFTFDRSRYFDEANIVTAYGKVSDSGTPTLDVDSGISTVTRTATTGLYEITLDAGVTSNANYVVVSSAIATGNGRIAMWDVNVAPTTTVFYIRRNVANSGAWGGFSFYVIGGQ